MLRVSTSKSTICGLSWWTLQEQVAHHYRFSNDRTQILADKQVLTISSVMAGLHLAAISNASKDSFLLHHLTFSTRDC